jgi:fructose/tagatose bisphosphate aldolase
MRQLLGHAAEHGYALPALNARARDSNVAVNAKLAKAARAAGISVEGEIGMQRIPRHGDG